LVSVVEMEKEVMAIWPSPSSYTFKSTNDIIIS